MEPTASLTALLSDDGRVDPYAFYARLHPHGQVCRLDAARNGYTLGVYGYQAVQHVLRDPGFRLMDADYMDRHRSGWRRHPVLRTLKDSAFFTNGPTHARIRRLLGQMFTARRVAVLAPAIAGLTNDLLDRLAKLGADGSPVDFMAEFAYALPSGVIGELLGIPEQDRAWFRPRVLAISAIFELDGSTWPAMAAADSAAEELTAYFAELAAARRAHPRQDLVSDLVQAHATAPDQLSEAELLANLITLFNAGFVTTTHMFGNGLTLLLDRPDLLATLRARPELATAYVDEILRYEPPAHFVVRYAAADTDIMGTPCAKDSGILVMLGAANRDPRRFADPDTFDPWRPDNQPLTFGAGPHYCLGAALTRTEGALALPMLFDRFPNLALARPPETPRQLMFRGHETLPVTVI